MGIFSRKKSAEPEVDGLLRHAPAHAALAASQAGDVEAAAAILRQARGQSRALVVDAISRNLSLELARQWTSDDPGSADAWVVRSSVEAHVASEIRGSGTADTVSTSASLDFGQLSAEARRSAERAAALDPTDAEPLSRMIFTCYALGTRDLPELLAELRRRDPEHVWGHLTAIDVLAEKWYGEADEARELAEDLAAAAPEGSLVPVVVPQAIREQWFYLLRFQKAREAAIGFVTMPETRAAIEAARLKSVDSPAHVPQPFTPLARNVFALIMSMSGDREGAAAQLAATDGLATEWPWSYVGGLDAWKKARRG